MTKTVRQYFWMWGLAIVVVLFAYAVWPTPYRYDHITVRGTSLPIRTNRLTGRTELFLFIKWIDLTGNAVKGDSREKPDTAGITWDDSSEGIGQ